MIQGLAEHKSVVRIRTRVFLQLMVFFAVVLLAFVAIFFNAKSGFLAIGESADKAIEQNRIEYQKVLMIQEKMLAPNFHNDIANLAVGNLKKQANLIMETGLYQSVAFFNGNNEVLYGIDLPAYKLQENAVKFEAALAEFQSKIKLPSQEKAEATALADKTPENQVVVVRSEDKASVLGILRRLGQKSQADGWIYSQFSLLALQQIEKDLIVQKQNKIRDTNTALLFWGMLSAAFLLLFIPFQMRYFARLLKPIEDITKAAEKMAGGDYSLEVSYAGKDEIGIMASSFRKMQQNQREKARYALRFADGDLSECVRPASTEDELGSALFSMYNNWNHMISEIRAAAMNISHSEQQIAKANESLEIGATNQSAAAEKTSTTMNEIDAQSKKNLAMANQVRDIVKKVGEASKKSDDFMQTMVKSMQEIQESNKKISSITKLTDDIAFQTNLLALNAAVEAARAGKHGKGFAVVAGEVRSLAGRSAKSAKDTSELIQQSGEKVQRGVDIAMETASALGEIHLLVKETETHVASIAGESEKQAKGIEQLVVGLNQISNITQQTELSAHEFAKTATSLKVEAERMTRLVSQFALSNTL